MEWHDEGIVLANHRHGEHGLIVHVLTRAHGRHKGLVRGGQGRQRRPLYEIGNALFLDWKARLAEHLGALSGELTEAHAARFLDDRLRLAALASAAALLEASLPEREPHPLVFAGMTAFLAALDRDCRWAAALVRLERDLLAELGFGLDLTRCAATGATTDLSFVSPRSGRAVSTRAAEPFRDRLLPLPPFIIGDDPADPDFQGILDGLALTGFFFERRVFQPSGRGLPAARSRFVDVFRQR